ncbi:MAG: hypothetical protein JJU20_14095 [Opitutales bacterium]|nr:hypothetical protein [Opitutales bacterium]
MKNKSVIITILVGGLILLAVFVLNFPSGLSPDDGRPAGEKSYLDKIADYSYYTDEDRRKTLMADLSGTNLSDEEYVDRIQRGNAKLDFAIAFEEAKLKFDQVFEGSQISRLHSFYDEDKHVWTFDIWTESDQEPIKILVNSMLETVVYE